MASGAAAAVGLGILGGVQGYSAEKQRTRNVKRAEQIARANLADTGRQIDQAEALQKQRRVDEFNRLLGSIRVSRSGAGVSSGSTLAALERQSTIDALIDVGIIEANAAASFRQAQGQLAAETFAAYADLGSPILAGLSGGLGGVQTGLAIDRGFRR